MQLIYLYIKEYRVWKKKAFALSADYKVEYSENNDNYPGKLTIFKKESLFSVLKEDGVYSSDIQLIVGKNGAGKSTLLRILMDGTQTDKSWFAVYLEEEEREVPEKSFVRILIEGNYFPDLGTNEPFGYRGFELRDYRGKVDEKKICCLQRESGGEMGGYRTDCALLLFRQLNPIEWFKDEDYKIKEQEIHSDFVFRSIIRKEVYAASCQQVLKYIWRVQKNNEEKTERNADDPENLFTVAPKNATLLISLEEIEPDGFWQELMGESLAEILEEYGANKKDAFITSFFSSLLFCVYKLQMDATDAYFAVRVLLEDIERKHCRDSSLNTISVSWKEYFYRILFYSFDNDVKMERKISNFKTTLNNLRDALQSLGESYYCFDSKKKRFFIETKIHEIYEGHLESDYGILCRIVEGIETINTLLSQRYVEFEKIQKPVRITFQKLSNGEVQLLHLFSSLHYGIEKIHEELSDINRKSNCILLLDEPDYGFHPEWSRRLIGCLQNSLKREPFTDFPFSYQLIITTHSPILLSDIPGENIICIHAAGEERTIKKTEFGVMSNINDLMKNSFFTDSLFGEAARQYTDRCIKELVELRKNVQEWPKDEKSGDDRKKVLADRIKNLEKRIRVIEEPMIRSELLHRLDVLKRSCMEQMMPEEKRREYWKLQSRMRALEEEYEGYPFR